MLVFKPEDFSDHYKELFSTDKPYTMTAAIANAKARKFNEAFKILLKQHEYNVKAMDCDDDKKILAEVMELLND